LPTFVTLQHRSTCTAGLLVALGLHGRGRVARRPIDGPWGRGGIRGLALACSTNNQVGIAGTAGLPPPAAHRLVLAYLHHPATLQHFRCRCHCRCRCHSAALGWLRPTGWCRPRRRPVPPAARPPANFARGETWKGNVGVSYKPTHGRPQHPPLHKRRAARHMNNTHPIYQTHRSNGRAGAQLGRDNEPPTWCYLQEGPQKRMPGGRSCETPRASAYPIFLRGRRNTVPFRVLLPVCNHKKNAELDARYTFHSHWPFMPRFYALAPCAYLPYITTAFPV
jgi:hypothetical protein